ncbi:TPA: hypothetical protein ACYSV4_001248, partial [Streptococcus suis]
CVCVMARVGCLREFKKLCLMVLYYTISIPSPDYSQRLPAPDLPGRPCGRISLCQNNSLAVCDFLRVV